jgi:hypothetical protein
LLVEAEGCVTLLRGHRIGDRFYNVYVSRGAVRSHDQRDYAVASNLFLSSFFGELWLGGEDELRRCDSVSSAIDAEEVWIGERLVCASGFLFSGDDAAEGVCCEVARAGFARTVGIVMVMRKVMTPSLMGVMVVVRNHRESSGYCTPLCVSNLICDFVEA